MTNMIKSLRLRKKHKLTIRKIGVCEKKKTPFFRHFHAEKECVTLDHFRNTQSQHKARNCSRVLPRAVESKIYSKEL